MSERSKKPKAKKAAAPKKKEKDKHEFETMSQIQNRYGKGREHGGSDGANQERGSNH